MALKLVPALDTDRAFYRHAHHIAYRTDIEKMFGWDEQRQDAFADKDFNERNPTIIYYGEIKVGVFGYKDKSDYIWFGPIFILPEFQGKNIGNNILKQFIDKSNQENMPLRLQTLIVNTKAKTWYEKLGFKVIEKTAIHWQMEYLPK
jgi:GNAT superfamily N-acetyltransferase